VFKFDLILLENHDMCESIVNLLSCLSVLIQEIKIEDLLIVQKPDSLPGYTVPSCLAPSLILLQIFNNFSEPWTIVSCRYANYYVKLPRIGYLGLQTNELSSIWFSIVLQETAWSMLVMWHRHALNR